MGILLRWLFAFLLIAATFNPTQLNYVRWVRQYGREEMPLALLLALLLLLVGYIIYLRATLRSIGGFGMLLVSAIIAALTWVLIDWGVMRLGNDSTTVWMIILALSTVLGVGLSWSLIRRRLSGQADVDDVDA